MADATILREFLMRLGFTVDKTSERTWVRTVTQATVTVTALGTAAVAAAAAATAALAKISEGMERLFFVSQRTGASVQNLQSYSFAIGQMGGSVDGALSSIESLARFIRNNPGGLDVLRGLGIKTENDSGQLRDTVELMKELGAVLAKQPYYLANQYGQLFGFDERTLMAMRQGVDEFADQYADMARRAGIDSQKAGKSAHDFMNEIRALGAAVGILTQKIGGLLTGRVAASMKQFRETFVDNFDRISYGIQAVVGVLLRVLEAISSLFGTLLELGAGLVKWWDALDQSTKDWIVDLGLLLAAIGALNIALSLSPVGVVLALGAALLALYNDYSTWAKGGNSLFDWGQFENEIQLVADVVKDLAGYLGEVVARVKELGDTKLGRRVGDALKLFSPSPFVTGNDRLAAGKRLLSGDTTGGEGEPGAAPAPGSLPDRLKKFLQGPAPRTASGATASGGKLSPAAVMQFFENAGWTHEQAAGITANLVAESGLNPNAVGDNGKARGLAQWHPDRQAAFKAKFGHDIGSATADEQLQFVQHELTAGMFKAAGDALRATMSADLAAQVVSTQYERPADREGEAARRGDRAVTLSQTTNINVNGGSSAGETAREVARQQEYVNGNMTRNLKGAMQ